MAGRIERLFVDIIGKNEQLKAALKQSDSAINQFARNTSATLTNVGSRFQQLGRQMTVALTLPILALGVAATKMGVEFETQFNKVIALTNATEEETKALREEIKRLGAETPFAAREVAEAFQFLALAGLSANESIIAAEGTLQLAQAGSLDLASAADIATNVLKGLRLEVDDLGRVNDVLAFTASNANTNILEFSEAAKVAGPVAAELSIPIEELATQIGVLADAGIKGSAAGTALRRGLLNLAAPSSQQADELERLNINVFDAAGNFNGLNSVIGNIERSLAGATQEQKAQTLELLFGARAVSSFAVLVNEGEESLNNFTTALEDSEGTAARIAETNLQGAPGAFARFKSAVEALAITISEQLLPVLTTLLNDYITPLVIAMANADEATIRYAIGIATLVATIGPALIIFGGLLKILAAGFTIFGGLAQVLQFLAVGIKAVGLAATGLSGGLLLLLAILIPLLLANEDFRDLLFTIFTLFKNLAGPLLDVASAFINLLLPIISTLITLFVPLIRFALLPTLIMMSLWAKLLPHVANAVQWLADKVNIILDPLVKLAEVLGLINDEAEGLADIPDADIGFNFDEGGLPDFGGFDINALLNGNAASQEGPQPPTTSEITINQYGVTSEEQTRKTQEALSDILTDEKLALGVD